MTFKELRKRKYRTTQDFAEKVDMSAQAISKWEQGVAAPKIKDLRKVAKALGISVNTLIECFEERGA